MTTEPRHRFAVLDGWRGVCALLVAIYHLMAATTFFAWPLVRHAQLFVDFFFVLSGFVIAYAYGGRLATPRDGFGFAIRRFGRMWPLHAAVLAALVGLEFVKLAAARFGHIVFQQPPFGDGALNAPDAIATNLLLIQSLGLHAGGTWNTPAWSVSVEFWTNLVFAALVVALPRIGLACAALAALGALVIARFSNMGATFDYGLFRCLYGFFVGVLVQMLWARMVRAKAALPAWVEVAALGAVVLFVWLPLPDAWLLAGPLVFALAVLAFAFEAGPVSRLMRIRPIHCLGLWSYSIYMVHWLVGQVANGCVRVLEAVTHRSLRVPSAYAPSGQIPELIDFGAVWINDLYALAYVAAVVALAATTFRLIEEPARARFNRIARDLERGRPPGSLPQSRGDEPSGEGVGTTLR